MKKTIITNGLLRAMGNAGRREELLRMRFGFKYRAWQTKLRKLKNVIAELKTEIRIVNSENKKLRRAVFYLENVNKGLTETQKARQTAKVDKILGLPKSIGRANDWHKATGNNWEYGRG